MRYGKFLPEKGTIGFVAPSFGCNIEPYRSAFINAQKIWEQQGYGFSLLRQFTDHVQQHLGWNHGMTH